MTAVPCSGVKDQAHVEEDDVSELERASGGVGKDADRRKQVPE